ncbi:hypothetical protein P171DRAFT_408389 [Karstenula rhodostoma CBS 690.94]|uniref:Uncharacterized protein n=1 Tax=Karstenula rhodostoma CBS 690.94 TaxID=1392251 RepID=A0A9P4PS47_9PLEO|nr:hypothetical protein P171DRAFT_408389 [Karstenula rhodostoma CBS 690.94]
MADALCGPSTALQTFQKHTSVDRTLQQDRLVGRHSPSQGFRSSLGPNNGAVDHEFEAFQAGHALPPQPQFQHLPPHLARPPPPQFAQTSQAPDWASDFQRLNISQAPQIPQQRVPAPNVASSWHQDFMAKQSSAAQAPVLQQNGVGGMAGYGMSGFARPGFQQSGFGMMNGGPLSEVAQGKQRAQEAVPQFDEAAFERAFADVQQAEERALADTLQQQDTHQETAVDNSPQETEDPALMRIREQRPAVYAALKIRSAVDLQNASQAEPYLDMLESMETNHQLTKDASEAKWVIDTLQNIAARETPQEIKARSGHLIRKINERLMSTYPLLSAPVPINQDRIWEELEAAGYTRPLVPEQLQQPQQPEQKQEEEQHQPRHDDDEMAQTAGRLLERVSNNTSEKFQNSQFLELMRRLRDREVRVEGDKMVEVSNAQSASSPPSSAPQQPQPQPTLDPLAANLEYYHDVSHGMDWSWSDPPSPAPAARTIIPPVDPNILDHAATDFDTPVYSGESHEYAPLPHQETSENVTDEVSDQYSYYNVHSTFHR